MKRLAVVFCALGLPACATHAEPEHASSKTDALDASNAVITWHANAQAVVAALPSRSNAAQAYTFALIQVAVYDAVVAIRGRYAPFISPSVPAPAGADLDAAIATAAYVVGSNRASNNTPFAAPTLQLTAYSTQYAAFLAGIPNGQAKTDGITVGQQAADNVLAARANDNFNNRETYADVSKPSPVGVWESFTDNPSATPGAADYPMRFVVPLTATSPSARRPPPPVNIKSARYARDIAELKAYGGTVSTARTPDKTDVAQFWTESGFTLWSRNVRALVTERHLDELEAARAFATVGVAMGDGLLACFEAKYHYLFWRPFQGIQRADEDDNRRTDPDPSWIPLVKANHPEYPSGHACAGTAATRALRLYFNQDLALTLTSTGKLVQITDPRTGKPWDVVSPRPFDSLNAIVKDTANARVWSGLHYRSTMEKTARWMKGLAEDAVCGRFGIDCRHEDEDEDENENDD